MMDDFGLYPREEPFDPLGVMLFKALQVIAFLFFLALLAVSPDAKDGKIDSKAEFMITLDWPRTAIPTISTCSCRIPPATSPGIATARPAS
ncbi:hypothetical protein ACVWZZ_000779 [Bradyrhizobium sp. LM6.10]